MVEEIPIGMPVSLRRENDPIGGNRFTGAQFAAPLAETDPVRRMQLLHDFVTTIRTEPALGVVAEISPVMAKLPATAIIELAAQLTTSSDMQVSNIRGISHSAYLAGAEVVGMYPLGPRPGVAVMAAMITYNGTCCLGLNVNPHVFPDRELLRRCIREGFDEVLAVGAGDKPGPADAPTAAATRPPRKSVGARTRTRSGAGRAATPPKPRSTGTVKGGTSADDDRS